MCVLCDKKIYTETELNKWLSLSSYDDTMPYNIIFQDIISCYLYTKVSNNYYNEDTRTLINYCPVCGEKL